MSGVCESVHLSEGRAAYPRWEMCSNGGGESGSDWPTGSSSLKASSGEG